MITSDYHHSTVQEARRLSGAQPAWAVAVCTAAFALGQIVEPLIDSLFKVKCGLTLPSLLAALALVASSVTLGWTAHASGKTG